MKLARHRLEDGTTVPWLASDAIRQMVASGVGVLVGSVLYLRLALQPGPEPPGDRLDLTMITPMFWTLTLYGAAYVGLTIAVLGRVRGRRLRGWLVATDPQRNRKERLMVAISGGGAISYAVTMAAFAVIAVLLLALQPTVAGDRWAWSGAVGTVVAAWSVLLCTFSVRYAHLWANRQGIGFPGRGARSLGDFLYLGVQMSTTFSPADVRVTSAQARRVTSVHALLAFGFNTIIIALLVSAVVG